eukprot:CAMPEP_0117522712 /NCGR_PEP_ID=MMETSP0784-20121206/34350_1 /TAXON_ID=39447 /ORGANISM="" /LENGTH=56 /DNA_ID=CAMNT_0005318795 /DNA_START=391 /DNA_END=559 /DNA_ORIENTATION=-
MTPEAWFEGGGAIEAPPAMLSMDPSGFSTKKMRGTSSVLSDIAYAVNAGGAPNAAW